MLSPPGSSSGAARRAANSNNRRKTAESPDDIIRQLQRVPANKKCADCSSKLPTCVNLTVGSFICMTCAGVHRELNARVKSVGHSSFSVEEAEQMKATDNDQLNALYMAKYSPSTERLRRPMDNRDPGLVRAWIHRKYQDRAWYGGNEEQHQQRHPTEQRKQTSEPQPTVVQIPSSLHLPPPQRKTAPRQAAVDLFADYNSSSNRQIHQQQPSQPQEQWDAFGNSANPTPTQIPFQADFANFSSQTDSFPADFGSSQARLTQNDPFQQITPASLPSKNDPFLQRPMAEYGQLGQHQQLQQDAQQYLQPGQLQTQQQFGNMNQQHQAHPVPPGGHQFEQFGSSQPQHHQESNQVGQNPAMFHGQNGMIIPQSSGQTSSGAGIQPFNQQQAFGIGMSNQQSQQHQNAGDMSHPSHNQFQQALSNEALPSAVNVTSAADAISAMNFHLDQPDNQRNEEKAPSKYKDGQKVYYKSASYSGEAEIVKVHLDDELKPFYTIKVDGKEKQTDEAHLEDLSTGNGDNFLLKEITELMGALSSAQLEKVLTYVKTVANEDPSRSGTVNEVHGSMQLPPIGLPTSNHLQTSSFQQTPQSYFSPTHNQNMNQASSESQLPNSPSGQKMPNATNMFAGIPSPQMNQQSNEMKSGSLVSPSAVQQSHSMQAPLNVAHQQGQSMLPPHDQPLPSYPQNQMPFQPQFQQHPQTGQNMNPGTMPSQFQHQAFLHHQGYQHGNGVHQGQMSVQPQGQPPITNFPSQQPPPPPMETPSSPKGNPFDFH